MNSKRRPLSSQARCPRCDEQLSVSPIERGRRGRVLVCPEPYCDYSWAPTEGEWARLGPIGLSEGAEHGADPEDLQRAAG